MFLIINQRENTVIEVQNTERGSVNASEQEEQQRGGVGETKKNEKDQFQCMTYYMCACNLHINSKGATIVLWVMFQTKNINSFVINNVGFLNY